MVTVTDSAKQELKHMSSSLDSGKALRLATPPVWTGEGDFGIVIDEPGAEDHAVELQGITVLLLAADLEKQLPNAVLDFKDSPEGFRFTLDVF